MTGLVWLGFVPAGLLAAGAGVRVWRRWRPVKAAVVAWETRQRQVEAEQQRIDAVFLDIVTTQLADLEVRRPQDGQ